MSGFASRGSSVPSFEDISMAGPEAAFEVCLDDGVFSSPTLLLGAAAAVDTADDEEGPGRTCSVCVSGSGFMEVSDVGSTAASSRGFVSAAFREPRGLGPVFEVLLGGMANLISWTKVDLTNWKGSSVEDNARRRVSVS